jgi:phosphosulfolactate synthase
MSNGVWSPIIDNVLNHRADKPREVGLTAVMDIGCGLNQTQEIIETAGAFLDHWKWGFGTSAFLPAAIVRDKLALLRAHDILTYPGGTLLEISLLQGGCRPFIRRARELGFNAVEVSDGSLTVPPYRRRNIMNHVLDAGLSVITEVGKKDPLKQPGALQLAELILQDLEWGASWVIVEARESGRGIGIYDQQGAIRPEIFEPLCEAIGPNVTRVIWEAPLHSQQADLIEQLGPNVNLGNIATDRVLALEALRAGFRFDTIKETVKRMLRSGKWDPQRLEALLNK